MHKNSSLKACEQYNTFEQLIIYADSIRHLTAQYLPNCKPRPTPKQKPRKRWKLEE